MSRQFCLLQRDARAEGFELIAASSYRSYASQLTIFNAKWPNKNDDASRVTPLILLYENEKLTTTDAPYPAPPRARRGQGDFTLAYFASRT